MNRIAFRGLRERKARTAFTLLAVVLGVALIAGTFVLTDTISKSFDKLVATAGENVDVKVLSRNSGDGLRRRRLADLPRRPSRRRCARVDGVAAAAGAFRAAVGHGGRRRAASASGRLNGAPTLAFSAVPERFDPFDYEGRAPATERRDRPLRDGGRGRRREGRRPHPRPGHPEDPAVHRGRASRRSAARARLGGAAFAVLTLPEVQALAGEPGKLTDLDVQAAAGRHAGRAQAARQRAGRAGRSSSARARRTRRKQSKDLVGRSSKLLTIGLLVFGLIALLVGSFVIFNTFTITVAQRTREFGMLRTIGASRRQILRAVVLEALLIGIVGSVLGLFAGIGLAPLLAGLLGLIGFDLPSTALVIAVRTIVVAILVGTLVTLLSSLAPALRATRDLAHGRDARGLASARRRPSAAGCWRCKLAVAGLGLALMLVGLFGGLRHVAGADAAGHRGGARLRRRRAALAAARRPRWRR